MKPLSCPSQFILWQPRAVKNNFQEKEIYHKCSTLEFVRLFGATGKQGNVGTETGTETGMGRDAQNESQYF